VAHVPQVELFQLPLFFSLPLSTALCIIGEEPEMIRSAKKAGRLWYLSKQRLL
jgi:hypothetical protein